MSTEKKNTSCKTPRWRMFKALLNNVKSEQYSNFLQQHPGALLVDVRTPGEYNSGYLNDAINIDYLGDGFLEKLEALDKKRDILIYCRSGRRSIRVCTLMRNAGFDHQRVFNLDEGILGLQGHQSGR